MSKHNYTKICKICGKKFRGMYNSKYCSKRCENINYKTYRYFSYKGLSTHIIGTISELLVVIDLLKKGYEVYRPLTPTNSADLVFEKNNNLFKIEVRTAYKTKLNQIKCNLSNIRASILAKVFLADNKIVYLDMKNKQDIEL